MSTTPGQLQFDGKAVAGIYLNVGAFGKQAVTVDADSAQLQEGDIVEATVRWIVSAKGAGSKYDHDGVAIGDRELVYNLAPVYPFVPSRIVTKEERDAAWAAHIAAEEA